MKSISITYRFIALSLALLIFATSSGVMVDMHYCNNELKSISFLGKAKSCHENPVKQCPHHQKMMAQSKDASVDTRNCCSNKLLYLQSDQDYEVQPLESKISQPLQQFLEAYITIFFDNNLQPENKLLTFANYKPPLIQRDIPVLFESFLL